MKQDAGFFTYVDPDTNETYNFEFYGAGHIVGTCRMGTKKENSVVDREQRSWDHPNLFLVGSGVFPTIATGNPSLTIAALAFWAADTIKNDL
jgi:choline dehydrogenase-like flavoprotein